MFDTSESFVQFIYTSGSQIFPPLNQTISLLCQLFFPVFKYVPFGVIHSTFNNLKVWKMKRIQANTRPIHKSQYAHYHSTHRPTISQHTTNTQPLQPTHRQHTANIQPTHRQHTANTQLTYSPLACWATL